VNLDEYPYDFARAKQILRSKDSLIFVAFDVDFHDIDRRHFILT